MAGADADPWRTRTLDSMPMRVAMLAAECEPWAKTGGLADVVDALARALGRLGGGDVETPVDVFLQAPDKRSGCTSGRAAETRAHAT